MNESKMKVSVGQMPGEIRVISLDENKTWTVGAVLLEAQMNATGYEIRVGGEPATVSTPITRDQTLLLIKPVQGNLA